jgi:hypothetical protein
MYDGDGNDWEHMKRENGWTKVEAYGISGWRNGYNDTGSLTSAH